MRMRILDTHTADTSHSAAAVFARWADPAGWAQWDPEVRAVTFDGSVTLGARGRIRPTSGPATVFAIVALEQERTFTNASSLPGARLVFDHRVSPSETGSRVTVSVGVTGTLAPLWHRVLRTGMSTAARASVTGLLTHLDAAPRPVG